MLIVSLYNIVVGIFCRWFIPFIGHMGICTMHGVIRDFAGPYFVSVSTYYILRHFCGNFIGDDLAVVDSFCNLIFAK